MHEIEVIENPFEPEMVALKCNICDKSRVYYHIAKTVRSDGRPVIDKELSFDEERQQIIKAFRDWITPLPCI